MPFFGVPIRNGLPIGLGSVAGFGVQQFDPSQLFEGGTVAGAWYDPSDLSTMFDTSAGTTPVAMPGLGSAVSVGLMLDKSQGLVLGSETVTNGGPGFTATTGWTAEGTNTVAVVGGELEVTLNLALFNGIAGTNLTTVAGQWYRIVVTARRGTTASNFILRVDSASNDITFTSTNSTTVNYYFRASGTSAGIRFLTAASGGTGTFYVTSVSVKAIAGNHAISFNNTTARPELRARVNLLTYSEEFNNGAWTKGNVTVTANAAVAPNGTTTADLMYPTTSGAGRSVYQTINNGSLISVYAKASGLSFIAFANTAGSAGAAWFDLSTGAVGTVAAGYTASIEDVGLGWYKCSLEALSGVFTFAQIYTTNSNNSLSVTASGTDGVLLWGADLRPANIGANVPAYQRIADALTYDTNGFPLYLRFDGVDDSMYTPANLNLSGTDKVSVFAGVRKLADTQGSIAELSATAATNNGSFNLFASVGGAARWFSALRGTALALYEPQTYTAPITSVLSTSFDIAGASISNEIVPRVNGIVEQDNPFGANAGTGNFGTYPLYIGSRNNTSDWLNGHLYSLAVVGSAVSGGNIAAMESWVAGKTGIQI